MSALTGNPKVEIELQLPAQTPSFPRRPGSPNHLQALHERFRDSLAGGPASVIEQLAREVCGNTTNRRCPLMHT